MLRVARVEEVHVAPRAAEPPRRRVPGSGGLVRGAVRAERDAVVARADLRGEGPVGSCADVVVARGASAARRHGGGGARGEWEESGERVGRGSVVASV